MKLRVSIFLLALGCSLVMRGAETNTALTIEAPGYEKFRLTLIPELGATNTYELKREMAK